MCRVTKRSTAHARCVNAIVGAVIESIENAPSIGVLLTWTLKAKVWMAHLQECVTVIQQNSSGFWGQPVKLKILCGIKGLVLQARASKNPESFVALFHYCS
jgi:hypothetical protein